jgi:hypothetical protein
MNQMSDIGNWLKCNLGAIEGAAASRGSRSEKLVAALLPFQVRLRLILGATRLVQNLLDL